MDYCNSKWFKNPLNHLTIKQSPSRIFVHNPHDCGKYIILTKLFNYSGETIEVEFSGEIIEGSRPLLKLINKQRELLAESRINTLLYIPSINQKRFIIGIFIPPKTKVIIKKIKVTFNPANYIENIIDNYFVTGNLLISPGYPYEENKYLCGFVHTRVRAYQNAGFNVDVAYINGSNANIVIYKYEGINVFRANYGVLRKILQRINFKRMLIHFFDEKYANVLDSSSVENVYKYFYLHGAETLYWDYNRFTSPYFKKSKELSSDLITLFKYKDEIIKKYNNLDNVKWVFVTAWTKERSEELIGVKYNSYTIIPCLIDSRIFPYEYKEAALRKKIFVLRKYNNENNYAVDIAVRTILELSRRDFFQDLEFNFYGDGNYMNELLQPLKDFPNIKIHKKFLTHTQIKEVHDQHGIALFPTRYDSQAVSSLEAASSGCVVVTSYNPGVRQFIDEKHGTTCEVENYIDYANTIEKIYKNEEYFQDVSRKMSKDIQDKCGYDQTIKLELAMFNSDKIVKKKYPSSAIMDKPVLSIIVPSYNAEKTLRATITSITAHKDINKIEILIINDGSTDGTNKLALELQKEIKSNGKEIIRIINQENSGHGGAINAGIKNAKGKYLKIIDADDTVNTEDFVKLIKILEKEDSDIVLNDYVEDWIPSALVKPICLYESLSPSIKYNFDDLCIGEYGFNKWGPLLPTSNIRTDLAQKRNITLLKNTFYVDMELNVHLASVCKTIKYFPLKVYRYALGSSTQSVNRESYKRHVRDHENVVIKMIEIFEKEDKLSLNKKNYIIHNLIMPMILTQYDICLDFFNNRNNFISFDDRLKKYPYFYNHRLVFANKKIVATRNLKGLNINLKKLNASIANIKENFKIITRLIK